MIPAAFGPGPPGGGPPGPDPRTRGDEATAPTALPPRESAKTDAARRKSRLRGYRHAFLEDRTTGKASRDLTVRVSEVGNGNCGITGSHGDEQ